MKVKIIAVIVMTLFIATALNAVGTMKDVFPNDPDFSNQYALHNTGQEIYLSGEGIPDADIDAPEAWEIETGNPELIIAVIDCGIDYTHPDLINNIWNNEDEIPDNEIDDDENGYIDDVMGWNFWDDNNELLDTGGHGTLCSGVISAEVNNEIGCAGVFWNCRIMPIHSTDEWDYGTSEDIANGIRYAADNGASVISMSFLQYNKYEDEVEEAVNYALDKGVVLVAAAGNDGYSTKAYPAAYENVIAVGGTDNKDQKMDCYRYGGYHFASNYGDWVDVAAPSVDVYTTMPTYEVTYNQFLNQNYDYVTGTSLGCPIIAGIAGLLLSKEPDLTPWQIKLLICNNVDPYDSNVYIGTGRANAHKALLAIEPPTAPTIEGETNGEVGKTYDYYFTSTDPNNDNISEYIVNWGDDTGAVGINGPFSSGEPAYAGHKWTSAGDYTVTVKAIDVNGIFGPEETLDVTMPRARNKLPLNTFLLRLLERFPQAFPIIRQLLGL